MGAVTASALGLALWLVVAGLSAWWLTATERRWIRRLCVVVVAWFAVVAVTAAGFALALGPIRVKGDVKRNAHAIVALHDGPLDCNPDALTPVLRLVSVERDGGWTVVRCRPIPWGPMLRSSGGCLEGRWMYPGYWTTGTVYTERRC